MTTKRKQPATSPTPETPAQGVPDLSKALQQPEHSKVPGILTPPQPVLPSVNDTIQFEWMGRRIFIQKILGGGITVNISNRYKQMSTFIEQADIPKLVSFLTTPL